LHNPTVKDPGDNSASAPDATASVGPTAPAIDEFAHIKRRTRPPFVALAAALLAILLAIKLREDVTYTLSPAAPQDLGDARALAAKSLPELPLNRYVRLAGHPDHESAVILDTQGSWKFGQLFRLRGTGGRVYVRRDEDPLPVARAERDVFTGRLLRFKDLSFADSIAKHFATHVTGTHFFRPQELAAALATRPVTLADLSGQRVTLAPAEKLTLDVVRPDDLRIELPRKKFATEALARRAVEAQGGRVSLVQPPAPDDDKAGFVVTAAFSASERERALSRLGDLDQQVNIRPARDRVEATVADISAAPDGLTVHRAGGGATVPLAAIASARTLAPVAVPDDAVLLIEDERPRDQTKTLVVLGFLIAFATANLLALRRPA
jgi:hypothetical protein